MCVLARAVAVTGTVFNMTRHNIVVPLARRDSVDVQVEFLDDEIDAAMRARIVGTEFQPVRAGDQKDGRQLLVKTFRMFESDVFVTALQFKAACNKAAFLAANHQYDDFLDAMNSTPDE